MNQKEKNVNIFAKTICSGMDGVNMEKKFYYIVHTDMICSLLQQPWTVLFVGTNIVIASVAYESTISDVNEKLGFQFQ